MVGTVGFYTKLHKLTKVNDQKLYLKAEDIANKMRIATGRGDDTRRHFMKKGVKKEELAELGLAELFKKEKVTQQEILEVIAANRVELEEKIYRTGTGGDLEFGKEIEDLDIQQAYGPDYVSKEAFERLREDTGLTSEANYFEWEDISPELPNYADSSELPRLDNQWELYKRGEWIYEDLDQDIKDVLMDKVAEEVVRDYYEDPLQRMTLTVVDQNAESTDVATKTSFNFSYSLVGNDSSGWRLADKEAETFKDGFGSFNFGAGLSAADLPSANEAEVFLRGLARSEVATGDMDLGSLGKRDDTRWEDNTRDGGDNYQERRFGLVGPERFSEGVHFADDINNIFHIRTKDRKGPNGEKILYVEELQSDWAQQGRKKGFYDAEKVKAGEDAATNIFRDLSDLAFVDEYLIDADLGTNDTVDILSAARNLRSNAQQQRKNINSAGKKLQKQAILDYFTPEQKMQVARQYLGAVLAREPDFSLVAQNPKDVLEIRVAELVDNPNALNQVVFNAFKENNELKERFVSDVSARLEAAGEDLSLESGNGKTGLAGYFHRKASEQAADQLEREGIPRNAFERIEAAIEKHNPDTGFNSFGEITPMIGDGTRVPGITITGLAEKQGDLPKAGPFVMKTEDWNKLAVKRVFQIAEEEGYDGVSFTPADVHIDRWGDEELRSQYDKSIPSAVRKVVGKVASKPDRESKMEVEGYESPIYFLDDINADGDTVSERVSGPLTMFSPAPITLAAGITGLGMAQKARADSLMAQGATHEMVLDALSGVASEIGGGLSGLAEYTRNIPKRIFMDDEESEALAARQEAAGDYASEALNYEPRSEMGRSMSKSAQEGIAGLLQPAIEYAKPEVEQFMDYIQSEEQRNSPLGALYRSGKYVYEDIFGEPERQAAKDALDLI